MLSRIKKSVSFHKAGFQILQMMHKIDSSVIPVYILHSLANALYPFINLFLSVFIIDSIVQNKLNETVFYVITLISLNFIFGILLDTLRRTTEYKSFEIHRKMQISIRKKALELDYNALENPKTLELITNAEFSMNYKGGFGSFITYYGRMLEAIISIIASTALVVELCFKKSQSVAGIMAFITSVPMSLVITFVFIIISGILNLYLANYFNNKSMKLFNEQLKFERKFNYIIQQIFLNIPLGKDIRIFNMKDMLRAMTEENRKKSIDFFKIYTPYFEIQALINVIANGISTGFAYIFVVIKMLANAISIGSITKYIGAISQLNESLSNLIRYNDEIRLTCNYLKNFTEFMKIENNLQTGTIPVEKRNDNVYEIEFHDVSFSYPGREEKVLNHVSCKLTLKDKIAVVGRNGAGKTTFIKLLCRLYEPTEGYITLNGIDIKKYNYLEYLSLFGVVFQDFNLFAFPLDQNVAASVTPEEEMVWKCLELAGIKERVEKMSEKLKTPLYKYDEDGVEISGGEAQKLAIARALYKNAPFVILDEPTAALDPISEYEIYSRFNELVKDKTSIYISHRMSSCRFCDDIIVFDEGSIIQRGSHNELVKDEDNLYAHLWNAQAKYYVSNKN